MSCVLQKGMTVTIAVRDVTWMSDQFVHLAKWLPVLEQVTAWHLVKCPLKLPDWAAVPA